MNTALENRLNAIVGKPFNFKGKNVVVEKYKLVSGTNCVVFMPGPHNFLISEIDAFLDALFDPTEKDKTEVQIVVPKQELITFEPTKENAIVKATLLDTLERIKTDPGYLPQAREICNVVNQIVLVQKNEIQMLGMINKFK